MAVCRFIVSGAFGLYGFQLGALAEKRAREPVYNRAGVSRGQRVYAYEVA
jgi:hypothetical protein